MAKKYVRERGVASTASVTKNWHTILCPLSRKNYIIWLTRRSKMGRLLRAHATVCWLSLPKLHAFTCYPRSIKICRYHIVSGNQSLCECIFKYLDLYLKPIVKLLPSYSRDTGDAIRKIENTHLEENMWIVTSIHIHNSLWDCGTCCSFAVLYTMLLPWWTITHTIQLILFNAAL